jgi:hypothetical protein
MSKSSFRFSISWPFIIGCYIVYSIFFGSDDDEKKAVDIKTTVNVEQKETGNKIDETVERIKKEINTSEIIQKAKDDLLKAKDELMKKDESEKVESEEIPEETVVEKSKPIEETPKLQDDKKEDPFDNMKPL